MVTTNKKVRLFILIFLISGSLFAQSDLNIFGFYQVRLTQTNGSYQVAGNVPTPLGSIPVVFDETDEDYVNSGVQQLNLFFQKELTNNISSFINVEMINNFSTDKGWGAFNLEEVWLKYQVSDAFNVKAGMLIPKFNYLNEIKNRMPLLPYVLRPLIYEASLGGTIRPNSYLPERAFLQVDGTIPVSNLLLNYAAYAGPSDREYIATGSEGATQPGTDTTNFKLFGGRVGVEYANARLGASFTSDKTKYGSDDVSRTRLGLDFGYNIAGLFFEGEYISVAQDTDTDTDKSFYYGLAGYNVTEQLYAYAYISQIKDKETDFLQDGMNSRVIGVGYRPTFSVVVKLEYGNYFISDGATVTVPVPTGDATNPVIPVVANMEMDYKSINLAVSVVF